MNHINHVTMAEYDMSAVKALEFLGNRLLNPEWASDHKDVAYFFKAPMAFWEAGRHADAERLLLLTVQRYLEDGGRKSVHPSYNTLYPNYPWVWMMWAAQCLGQHQLCQDIWARFKGYIEPQMCAGTVNHEMDYFATTHVLMAAILAGKKAIAQKAAGTLLQVLQKNQINMTDGHFILRWVQDKDGAIVLMNRKNDPQSCIAEREFNQKFYMLGFPAQALLELARQKYIGAQDHHMYEQGAHALLKFLKKCIGIWNNAMCHKVARAAAMAGDAQTSTKIMDYIASIQKPEGCYQEDREAMNSIDQTAELAFWFQRISKELACCSKSEYILYKCIDHVSRTKSSLSSLLISNDSALLESSLLASNSCIVGKWIEYLQSGACSEEDVQEMMGDIVRLIPAADSKDLRSGEEALLGLKVSMEDDTFYRQPLACSLVSQIGQGTVLRHTPFWEWLDRVRGNSSIGLKRIMNDCPKEITKPVEKSELSTCESHENQAKRQRTALGERLVATPQTVVQHHETSN